MPVVDTGDEVGQVIALLAIEGVRDGEAEVLVLDVAGDLVHLFEDLRHLLFPGAGVGDDVRDVALVRRRSRRRAAWCRSRRSASSRSCRRAAGSGRSASHLRLERRRSPGRCGRRPRARTRPAATSAGRCRPCTTGALGPASAWRSPGAAGKSHGLVVALVVAEVLLEQPAWPAGRLPPGGAVLELVECVDDRLADDRRVFDLGRHVCGREHHSESAENLAVSRSAGNS